MLDANKTFGLFSTFFLAFIYLYANEKKKEIEHHNFVIKMFPRICYSKMYVNKFGCLRVEEVKKNA